MKNKTLPALLLLLYPLTIWIIWIYSFNAENTQQTRVSLFHEYLPEFLRDGLTLNVSMLLACAAAFGLAYLSKKQSPAGSSYLNAAIMVLSFVLGGLVLFGMM